MEEGFSERTELISLSRFLPSLYTPKCNTVQEQLVGSHRDTRVSDRTGDNGLWFWGPTRPGWNDSTAMREEITDSPSGQRRSRVLGGTERRGTGNEPIGGRNLTEEEGGWSVKNRQVRRF